MTYYIDYRAKKQKNIIEIIKNKLSFRFSIINIDNTKKCIYINKKYIDNKAHKKLDRYLKRHNYELFSKNVLIANNIQIKSNKRISKKNDINDLKYIPKEKYIMKSMICNILKYIETNLNIDYRNECIYISIIKDMNKDTFFDISDIFKGINFVTTRHGYIRRIEKTILKHNDTPTSVSNNRRKALLRAKILINFDFDNDLLSEFEINKDCIIVNLSNNKISLRKNFRGCIIDGVKICFKNRYEKHINSDKYNIEELYNSYIQNLDYCKAVEHNNLNDCKIINLVGNRGIILNDEIVNNFTNSTIRLDKKRKKD